MVPVTVIPDAGAPVKTTDDVRVYVPTLPGPENAALLLPSPNVAATESW